MFGVTPEDPKIDLERFPRDEDKCRSVPATDLSVPTRRLVLGDLARR
jgi:hypothetical protein